MNLEHGHTLDCIAGSVTINWANHVITVAYSDGAPDQCQLDPKTDYAVWMNALQVTENELWRHAGPEHGYNTPKVSFQESTGFIQIEAKNTYRRYEYVLMSKTQRDQLVSLLEKLHEQHKPQEEQPVPEKKFSLLWLVPLTGILTFVVSLLALL